MKRIAVTGANGFIGSNLCTYLQNLGNQVLCLVRPGSATGLLPISAEVIRTDYSDLTQMEQILEKTDIFIHLAALTRARKWQQFQKTNIDLVETLVQLANSSPSVKQFILYSSQAASGPALSANPKKEEDECQPISFYGRSKLAAEAIVREECLKNWTIIRPVSVFGAGEKDFLQYYKMIKKGIAPLIGFRHKYVSLIHISDLCELTNLTIDNEKANNQVFFAASSEYLSMAAFAQLVSQALQNNIFSFRTPEPLLRLGVEISEFSALFTKKAPLFNRQKFKEMRQRYWLASNDKAKELLGFRQGNTLVNQMKETIDWYLDKGIL